MSTAAVSPAKKKLEDFIGQSIFDKILSFNTEYQKSYNRNEMYLDENNFDTEELYGQMLTLRDAINNNDLETLADYGIDSKEKMQQLYNSYKLTTQTQREVADRTAKGYERTKFSKFFNEMQDITEDRFSNYGKYENEMNQILAGRQNLAQTENMLASSQSEMEKRYQNAIDEQFGIFSRKAMESQQEANAQAASAVAGKRGLAGLDTQAINAAKEKNWATAQNLAKDLASQREKAFAQKQSDMASFAAEIDRKRASINSLKVQLARAREMGEMGASLEYYQKLAEETRALSQFIANASGMGMNAVSKAFSYGMASAKNNPKD